MEKGEICSRVTRPGLFGVGTEIPNHYPESTTLLTDSASRKRRNDPRGIKKDEDDNTRAGRDRCKWVEGVDREEPVATQEGGLLSLCAKPAV